MFNTILLVKEHQQVKAEVPTKK